MSKRPEYTKGTAQSMVAVIECVYSLHEERDIQEVLEQLQQYGAARVVERFAVKESFDDATKILNRRAKL